MKKLFLFLVASFLLNYSYGQSKQDKQLIKSMDQLLSGQFKQNEPGVAILVAKSGNIVYEKAFGSANIELNVTMQPDMVFRIGSVTKQFTAVAILQLVEQGKISLHDSIQQYVRDFPPKGSIITIENLLTHTSGIPDYANADTTNIYIEREDFTPQRLINYFRNLPLEFKPGTKYDYSNSNYVLLGYIIQMVTGKEYHSYMQENIIKPAGLINTYYASENTIVPKRVTGYTRNSGYYENCDYQTISLGYACGDLMSSVKDLYKWNNVILFNKLIKKETVEKAFTPYKLNNGNSTSYGYGWFIDNQYGSKCIHHEGQVSGFIALEKYFPDEDIFIAILTNVKSGEDKTDFSDSRFRLFDKISSLALNAESQKEVKISDKLLNNYAGTYQAGKQTIDIRNKNGHLSCFASMEGNFDLMPVTENKFVIINSNPVCSFEFIKDSLGNVTEFISLQKAKFDWIKIDKTGDKTSGANEQLDAYTGEYQLGAFRKTFITIIVENNHLLASSTTALPTTQLIPVSENTFKYNSSDINHLIEFIKDTDGKVRKLTMTQGEVHCKKIKY